MWISLDLFCLNFVQLVASSGLCILPLWKFHPSFHQVLFQPPPYLSPPSRSLWHNINSFISVIQVPGALFIFSVSFIPIFQTGNFYIFLSISQILSSASLIYFWAHVLRFLFLLLYFSVPNLSFGFSLYFLFPCWDFLFFHLSPAYS